MREKKKERKQATESAEIETIKFALDLTRRRKKFTPRSSLPFLQGEFHSAFSLGGVGGQPLGLRVYDVYLSIPSWRRDCPMSQTQIMHHQLTIRCPLVPFPTHRRHVFSELTRLHYSGHREWNVR